MYVVASPNRAKPTAAPTIKRRAQANPLIVMASRLPTAGFYCPRRSLAVCSVPSSPSLPVGRTKSGFIRTATTIGRARGAGSVRINPVGLSRVAAPPRAYGDCKAARAWRGGLSTDASERERPLILERRAGRRLATRRRASVVGGLDAPSGREAQPHRPDACPLSWSAGERVQAGVMTYPAAESRARSAVICIRPSPHTGQRARSMPVSRCISTATDSG